MFKRFSIIFCLIFCLIIPGCSNNTQSSNETSDAVTNSVTEYPVTIKDSTGDVTIESEPERIVSLAPSVLEILFALNSGDRVVGRTDYGNYPPEAQDVATIGGFSDPNVELILEKDPDLIIGTDLISDDVKKQLETNGAKVLTFTATSVDETKDIISEIGIAINSVDAAQNVNDEISNQLDELEKKLETKGNTKTVFIDFGDYYSCGPKSFLDNELKLIGADNIAQDSNSDYPQLTTEQIVAANPDVYISFFTPVEQLKEVSGFDSMNCFKNNQIYYIDPNSQDSDMIERPGPRIIEGMTILAKDIYPECFSE